MTEQLNSWKAEQQIQDEHLRGRISTLELEVSKLQRELNQAQKALKTSTPAQLDQNLRWINLGDLIHCHVTGFPLLCLPPICVGCAVTKIPGL